MHLCYIFFTISFSQYLLHVHVSIERAHHQEDSRNKHKYSTIAYMSSYMVHPDS
jgi:hypothetical protein